MKKLLLLFLATMGGMFLNLHAAGGPGDSLADPIVVPSLPYNNINRSDTCYTNQYVGRASNDVFYQFTTGACSNGVTISTCSDTTDFDTYIYLLDSAGNQIALNDDSPTGTCSFTLNGNNRFSVINITLAPSATYYVVVDGFGAGDTGTFELSIEEPPIVGDSLQDPIAIASLPFVGLNNSACYSNQNLGSPGLDVFYSLVTSPCTDSLFISTCSDSTDFNTFVYLLDANGTVVASNDDSPSGTCNLTLNGQNLFSVVNAQVSPQTQYYIVVDGSNAADFGQFELSVSESLGGAPGDSLADAIQVPGLPYNDTWTTSTCYSNQFVGQGSPDVFYEFQTGPCADSIFVSTCSPNTTFDTYIHLLDSAGNAIAFNDDAITGSCSFTLNGLNRFSTIFQAVSPNTTYYVVVEGFGGTNNGAYDLTIGEIINAPRDSFAAATPITFPYNTIDSTDCNTDFFQGRVSPDQFYTFTTGACAPRITISTCSDTTNFDTYVWLLDSTGNVVASNDDSPLGTCSFTLNGLNRFSVLETATMANTTYFIVVEGFGATDFGRYELNVTAELPTGDSLADPILIPGLPYVDVNSNAGCYSDQFQGQSSEVFYQLNTSPCADSITISTCSGITDFDSYVFLLDSAGNTVAFNDNAATGACDSTLGGNNVFSVLTANVDPNTTYYIVVEGSGTNDLGTYELSVTGVDLSVPGDSFSTAIPVPSLPYTDIGNSAECFTDQFQGRSTEVFYTFTTSACSDSVQISTCSDTTDFDTYVYLLDSTGNVITFNDDATAGLCGFTLNGLNRFSIINAAVAPNTTYYVVVDGFGAGNAGTYELTITEMLDSLDIVVDSTMNSVCPLPADGAVFITVSGGNGPYTYDWGNGITDEDPIGLGAGTYTVTVTDTAGCMGMGQPVTLTAPMPFAIMVDNTSDALCNGDSTGSISITVTGGTQPYTFDWGNGITAEDPAGLTAGTYTVMVMDTFGCVETGLPVTIGEPTALSSSTVSTDESVPNAMDGSVTLTIGGGTPPYSFMWDNGDTTQDLTGVSGGVYCYTATDSNGCVIEGCDTVGVGVSIDQGNALARLNIYPNPTSGIAMVDLETYDLTDVEVELVNSLGAVLYTEKAEAVWTHRFKLDLNNYAQGVFVVRVKAGGRMVSRSLILSR